MQALYSLLGARRGRAVHLPALQCLAFLVIGNDGVAAAVATCGGGGGDSEGSGGGDTMLQRIVALMERSRPIETQLAAARCITYLYRCGILEDKDDVILYKVLPCVVSDFKTTSWGFPLLWEKFFHKKLSL